MAFRHFAISPGSGLHISREFLTSKFSGKNDYSLWIDVGSNDLHRIGHLSGTKSQVCLWFYSKSKSDVIRSVVACNDHTPPSLLSTLSYDESVFVRVCVSSNRNTPEKELLRLYSEDSLAQAHVLANPSCPEWFKVMHT